MLSFQYNTIKFYENSPIKNEGSPLLAQNEVRVDIFSGSLAVFQSERVASAGGRKRGLGGIPPALQILGEICSNFFERTPPSVVIALAEAHRQPGTVAIYELFTNIAKIQYGRKIRE